MSRECHSGEHAMTGKHIRRIWKPICFIFVGDLVAEIGIAFNTLTRTRTVRRTQTTKIDFYFYFRFVFGVGGRHNNRCFVLTPAVGIRNTNLHTIAMAVAFGIVTQRNSFKLHNGRYRWTISDSSRACQFPFFIPSLYLFLSVSSSFGSDWHETRPLHIGPLVSSSSPFVNG